MHNVYSVLNIAAQIVDKTVEKFKPRIQITQQKKENQNIRNADVKSCTYVFIYPFRIGNTNNLPNSKYKNNSDKYLSTNPLRAIKRVF